MKKLKSECTISLYSFCLISFATLGCSQDKYTNYLSRLEVSPPPREAEKIGNDWLRLERKSGYASLKQTWHANGTIGNEIITVGNKQFKRLFYDMGTIREVGQSCYQYTGS